MDIKDFILIAGGTLIALVIAHGFWIAYRAKREPLRMDIVPDLIPDDVDDMERLRGELPNGGARVINKKMGKPSQTNLDLDVPVLTSEPQQSAEVTRQVEDDPLFNTAQSQPADQSSTRRKPQVHQAPARYRTATQAATEAKQAQRERIQQNKLADVAMAGGVGKTTSEPRVSEVQLELPAANEAKIVPDEQVGPQLNETMNTQQEQVLGATSRDRLAQSGQAVEAATAPTKVQEIAKPQIFEKGSFKQEPRSRDSNTSRPSSSVMENDEPALNASVEELLVVNLIAPRGHKFNGEDLVNGLRKQGLRYGDMSIFHRLNPLTKAKLYSVANIVEPGTFDLADLETLSSPGISFFLQLPGPDQASDAFEDMLTTARNLSSELGGELRDEQLSVLTRQTAEHMRERIAEYARRKLSKRA